MSDKPQHILYVRPDTIGDLVIFSSALMELQKAWPEARHTLVVRPGYDELAPLFPTFLEWHVARLNPFTQKPSECRAELAGLLKDLETLQPDVIVAPTVNRTWLELAIAAHFPAARRVALGQRAVDPLFAAALRLDLGVEVGQAFNEIVAIDERDGDWANNHRLIDQLAGHTLPRSAPRLNVPPAATAAAKEILTAENLPSRAWTAVFPAGLANVPIKAWPAEKFATLIRWLQQEQRMPLMLLGHVSEAPLLEDVRAAVVKLGGAKPALWLGREGELPLLAALLDSARFYIGHDTGAMHLAAALGRPVVGIFGGGHWPRFRPVGRQVLSVVQPLPCFGCNWDCHFGDAPCVKTLAVADVQAAIQKLFAAGDAPIDDVVEARNLSAETLQLIAAETPRYIALQRDRIDRQHKIEELKRETDIKDTEIASLKQAADFKDAEIASLKKEADTKDVEITDLKSETNTKDTEIAELKKAADDIKAELEAECAGKDAEIAELKTETDGKDHEIASLKQISNEREQLIFTLDGHVKEFQRIVATLNAQAAEKERRIGDLQAELNRVATSLVARETAVQKIEALFAKLPTGSMNAAEVIAAKEVHIQNLERVVADLKKVVADRDQSLANYAAGYATLEQAKHYGRLLSEKEAVVQSLHTACVAREVIIRQLAAEATTPTAKLRKLWIAVTAHFREKWWRPFDTWLFKKVVEEHWMQIGVLRHYEGRTLVWDKFPKPRLPDTRLPQIGIVTPSYGQAQFIESTMLSVLNQNYPKLLYVVQDGRSGDASPQIIARHASRLRHWESVKDDGQADAVRRGFAHIESALGPDDIMAWLNSDDFISPRALRYVAEYFATHPRVDVLYGHRIIIDGEDREIGRWIMPRHDPKALEWIDYVPQETLFWRKRAWVLAGGIDPSFQFALDWDLLARFTQAGCRIVRVPRFLGCFRVHHHQKTSQAIHTTGAEEMKRIRTRFHGEKQDDFETINAHARQTRFWGAIASRLHNAGIRW